MKSTLCNLFVLLTLCQLVQLSATAHNLTEEQIADRRRERLAWLTITKPGATDIRLSCASKYEYPFSLLTSGSVGKEVSKLWWILPNGQEAYPGHNDGHVRVSSNGVELIVAEVKPQLHGIYHCVADAQLPDNETVSRVYFYKRGLNLYGADVYNNMWEKYRMNLLTGLLTSGSFLALVASYAAAQKFGILDKCRSDRAKVAAAPDTSAKVSDDREDIDSAAGSGSASMSVELHESKVGRLSGTTSRSGSPRADTLA